MGFIKDAYLAPMVKEDPEALLRAMVAPLSRARRDEPLPGVPFSREAVANAFVMLGLLPEARAEEILAEYRPELEAKGFRMGVLTGELSVRPGAHGYQDALAASRDDLTGIPLAVAVGPVPIAFGDTDLVLTWATLTPGGVKLRLRAVIPDPDEPHRRPIRGRPGLSLAEEIRFELPGQRFAAEVRSGLSVTDDLGRTYRLQPVNWGDAPGRTGAAAVETARCWRSHRRRDPRPAALRLVARRPGAGCAGWSSRWRRASPFGSSCLRPHRPIRVRPSRRGRRRPRVTWRN